MPRPAPASVPSRLVRASRLLWLLIPLVGAAGPGAAADEPAEDPGIEGEATPSRETDASDGAWDEGPVEVVRIFQPGILQLARGEERAVIRLRGIDCPRRGDTLLLRRALDRARELLEPGGVVLEEPAPIERDQFLATLRLRDGSTLAERLLEAGDGFYDPTGVDATEREILVRAQERAHAAEVGIWGLPIQETTEATRVEGRIARICGDSLASQRQPDGSWHVYLGAYPHRHVIIVIPSQYVADFEAPSVAYTRQEVCAVGRVEGGSFLPEIVVRHPMQLEARGLGQSF